MIGLSVRGDDLAAFARQAATAMQDANAKAPKRAAANMSAELKKQINSRFNRVTYWNAPGFAKAIRWKQMGPGWWRLYSRAVYAKGRTEPVDLLWFFDQPQKTVYSGFGKGGVAVPIPGHGILASSGRRYAWPSELAKQGWTLEFVHTANPRVMLILGKRGHEKPRPLFFWMQSTKPKSRLDVQGLFDKHAATLDELWGHIIDEDMDKRSLRRAA